MSRARHNRSFAPRPPSVGRACSLAFLRILHVKCAMRLARVAAVLLVCSTHATRTVDLQPMVQTTAELTELLSEGTPVYVWFADNAHTLKLTLPESEDDRTEAAWFAKLSAVWPSVRAGEVPWATRGSIEVPGGWPLKFVVADRQRLLADGFETADGYAHLRPLPTGLRLLQKGVHHNRPEVTDEFRDESGHARLFSRRHMQAVLHWTDTELSIQHMKSEAYKSEL